MLNILLAIGAGVIAVLYGSVATTCMLAAIPGVVLAAIIIGVKGIRVDLVQWLFPLEVILIGAWFFSDPTANVVMAAFAIPLLFSLWLLDWPRR